MSFSIYMKAFSAYLQYFLHLNILWSKDNIKEIVRVSPAFRQHMFGAQKGANCIRAFAEAVKHDPFRLLVRRSAAARGSGV